MQIGLSKGALLRIKGDARGVTVVCAEGMIWLTQGDVRDYIVAAGESFTISQRGVVVVEAWRETSISLTHEICRSSAAVKAGAAHGCLPRLPVCQESTASRVPRKLRQGKKLVANQGSVHVVLIGGCCCLEDVVETAG